MTDEELKKWAKDQMAINQLREENEHLRMRCKVAEERVAMYAPALSASETLRIAAQEELARLKVSHA